MSHPIYIQLVVGTDQIIENYPNLSQNPDTPTEINSEYVIMIGNWEAVRGQASDHLSLIGFPGDSLRFSAVSTDNNFEEEVLIYNFEYSRGERVIEQLGSLSFKQTTVFPKGHEVLPATIGPKEFYFFQGTIVQTGFQQMYIDFALYTRNESGDPEIFGYFRWLATFRIGG